MAADTFWEKMSKYSVSVIHLTIMFVQYLQLVGIMVTIYLCWLTNSHTKKHKYWRRFVAKIESVNILLSGILGLFEFWLRGQIIVFMEHVKKIRASCWAHFNAKSLIWKEGKQTPLSYKSSFAFFPNEVRQHHVKNTFLHQPVEYYREVRYDFAGIRITTTSLFPLFSLRCYLSNWVISSAIKQPKK